jgi:signal peptidase II
MGMIIGGAIGNIIDRLIMAKIGGYGGILDGHVVDFIHFMPTIGGHQVFPYVFNVADSSITIAIICLLLFSKQIFQKPDEINVASNNKGGTEKIAAEPKTREQTG